MSAVPSLIAVGGILLSNRNSRAADIERVHSEERRESNRLEHETATALRARTFSEADSRRELYAQFLAIVTVIQDLILDGQAKMIENEREASEKYGQLSVLSYRLGPRVDRETEVLLLTIVTDLGHAVACVFGGDTADLQATSDKLSSELGAVRSAMRRDFESDRAGTLALPGQAPATTP